MTALAPRLAPDRDETRGHCEMIHRLAAPLAGRGKIVVASYGENPTTGDAITPKVAHFKIGDVEAMTRSERCGKGESPQTQAAHNPHSEIRRPRDQDPHRSNGASRFQAAGPEFFR